MKTNSKQICIVPRALTAEEQHAIIQAIRTFPDLAYVRPKLLASFTETYVAEVQGEFAGFCAVETYRGMRKLGPIAVLPKFHHSGAGKTLMMYMFTQNKGKNAYFGSSNPKVQALARKMGAVEFVSVWQVPKSVRLAALHLIVGYLSPRYFWEMIRKKLKYGRGRYIFFRL